MLPLCTFDRCHLAVYSICILLRLWKNTRQIQTSATSRQASEEGLKKKKKLEIVVISSSSRWNRLVILSGPLAKLSWVKEIDGEI